MKVLAACLALALPAVAHADPIEYPGPFKLDPAPIVIVQDAPLCARQPKLTWCADQSTAGKGLPIETIKKMDELARRSFMQQPGNETSYWNSYADKALANKVWFGYCNDLAFTVLDLLFRNGQTSSTIWRLGVASYGIGAMDHMVGLVQANDGSMWVVGDTLREGPYPLSEMKYKPVMISSAYVGTIWFKIAD